MSKSYTKAIAVIATILVVGLIGIGCWIFFVENGNAGAKENAAAASPSLFSSAKNDAMNAAIDASGIKGKIEDTLLSHSSSIAEATGLSQSEVDAAIGNLDIQEWSATTLPTDAKVENSISSNVSGVEATVTTYEDPSYVTVNAYGQDITMAVPSSAQQYTDYLGYLSAAS